MGWFQLGFIAGAHEGVAVDRDRAGERGEGVEELLVGDRDAAAEGVGVGDQVVPHGDVGAAVDRDAVGEVRLRDGVVLEAGTGVGRVQRPHGEGVVALVAQEVVADADSARVAVEVEAVGGGVEDAVVLDDEVVVVAHQPEADLQVLDPHAGDRTVRPQRAVDEVVRVGVDAFGDLSHDGEVLDVDASGRAGLVDEAGGVHDRVPAARALQGDVLDAAEGRGQPVVARRDPDHPPWAAEIASRKAWVESPLPLGSAPLEVTETERTVPPMLAQVATMTSEMSAVSAPLDQFEVGRWRARSLSSARPVPGS